MSVGYNPFKHSNSHDIIVNCITKLTEWLVKTSQTPYRFQHGNLSQPHFSTPTPPQSSIWHGLPCSVMGYENVYATIISTHIIESHVWICIGLHRHPTHLHINWVRTEETSHKQQPHSSHPSPNQYHFVMPYQTHLLVCWIESTPKIYCQFPAHKNILKKIFCNFNICN